MPEPTQHTQPDDREVLVKVENVSKKFCRDLKKSLWYGVQDVASELVGRKYKHELRPDEFWSVKDVSFELRRGECLGLIGRNGAGKTTLLRMLNGLIKPDQGRIEMNGRVNALIALGAGFNPILTGRENILVNASVLGISKQEIDQKLQQIIDFSQIGEFIDAPVQSYSSGMNVRLGFGVATALEPDILLIDEVLAVGDTAFKVRCYNLLQKILPNTAVVIVSHNMFDISRTCTQAIVMAKGAAYFHGHVEESIHVYNELNYEGDSDALVIHCDEGIGEVNILEFRHTSMGLDTHVHLEFSVESACAINSIRIRLVFFNDAQIPVAEWDSNFYQQNFELDYGTNYYKLDVSPVRLTSGSYRVAVVVTHPNNSGYILSIEYGLSLEIKTHALSGAPYKI